MTSQPASLRFPFTRLSASNFPSYGVPKLPSSNRFFRVFRDLHHSSMNSHKPILVSRYPQQFHLSFCKRWFLCQQCFRVLSELFCFTVDRPQWKVSLFGDSLLLISVCVALFFIDYKKTGFLPHNGYLRSFLLLLQDRASDLWLVVIAVMSAVSLSPRDFSSMRSVLPSWSLPFRYWRIVVTEFTHRL